jgi:hypothetical protein
MSTRELRPALRAARLLARRIDSPVYITDRAAAYPQIETARPIGCGRFVEVSPLGSIAWKKG